MRDRILGELIGLARCTENNEHLISASTTTLVLEALACMDTSILPRIEAEKRRMVPDCFACASPCGRNNAYDLAAIPAEEKEQKARIAAALRSLCGPLSREGERMLFLLLIILGVEGLDNGELRRCAEMAERLKEEGQ